MSSGNYSHTTRAGGTTLTAAIYNADHQNHITNANPTGMGGYSDSASQMRTQTDPGEQSSESLATSTAGELERLRHTIAELKGKTYWYETTSRVLMDVNQPPLIGNSAFDVWFENTIIGLANGTVGPEGWYWEQSGVAGLGQFTQETASGPTFAQVGAVVPYWLSNTIINNDNSIAAGDKYAIVHKIEGMYWAPVAQTAFTLSFWVKGAKTGTHCVAFRNSGNDRSYVATYTINSANTWEYKTISVSASPSAGTWSYTNGIGLTVAWTLAAGSTHQTTAGTWQTGNFLATSAQVNECDTVSNVFGIACPKITPGPTAGLWLPPQGHIEVARAIRYFQSSFQSGNSPSQAFGATTGEHRFQAISAGATAKVANVSFNSPMRAVPTITLYNPSAANAQVRDLTNSVDCTGSTVSYNTDKGFLVSCTGNAATTANAQLGFHWSSTARL